MLRVHYEAAFGWSVGCDEVREIDGIMVQKYKIQKKDGRATGIQQKMTPAELLTQYLNPQFADGLGYQYLKGFNNEAIKRLKQLQANTVTASKISLIVNLNIIIDNYVKNEKPLQQAKQSFLEYINVCAKENGTSDLMVRNDNRNLLS